ncbi:MAG: imidazole glycerol phosphate synthase subunit HisH [Prevotellaceae bacterium]|jgi:glutamine amidotransferase|nr:imidazole glycerol phosphate synthase subunit HisH [Prevotellaceae bacterium]
MVAIIKYNAGNIRSVENAMRRIGCAYAVTDNPDVIRAADRVIFPGVGEASTTMRYLREHHLDELIVSLRQPVLGICIGLQLMCAHSDEGDVGCLGLFDERVSRFADKGYKVPHVGWNTIAAASDSPLFAGLPREPYVYFVHSYCAEVGAHTIATTGYGRVFSAALRKNNFYALQFHPEKSGEVGERILRNFLLAIAPTYPFNL